MGRSGVCDRPTAMPEPVRRILGARLWTRLPMDSYGRPNRVGPVVGLARPRPGGAPQAQGGPLGAPLRGPASALPVRPT